jgi:hypothetical protein
MLRDRCADPNPDADADCPDRTRHAQPMMKSLAAATEDRKTRSARLMST